MNPYFRFALLISWTSYPLFFLFFPNVGFIRDGGLTLPIIVFNVTAFLIYYLLQLFSSKKNNSAIIATFFLVAFQVYGHVYYGIMDGFSIPYEAFKHRYYLPLYLIIAGLFFLLLLKRKEVDGKVVAVFSIIGTVLCLQFTPQISDQFNLENHSYTAEKREPQELKTPDIYYLILDSYSTKENLQEFYGFDNSSFENQLSTFGFKIIPKAKSNYPYTYFSLSSSLNIRYVNDFEDSVKLEKYDDDYPFTQIHRNKVVHYLRDKGYRYVLSKSAYDQLNDPTSADVFIDNASTLNQFHQAVVSLSLLSAFNLDAFYHHKNYDITRQAYDNWDEILAIGGSKFVFFHSLPPHPPFVFNADGSYRNKEGRTINLYAQKEDYIAQTKYVNQAIIVAVEKIIKSTDGNAIIIIQGDHGTCSSTKYSDEMKWPIEAPKALIRERYGILNAIYVPENLEVKLDADHTPVNTFRKILNATFSDSLPMLENHHFYGRYRPPYGWKEIKAD